MEPFLRYALSHPLDTVVVGCDDLRQVEENVRLAARFTPMSEEERRGLEHLVAPSVRQLRYYRP